MRTFFDCHKPHNKAIYGTLETARNISPKTVHSRSCCITAYILRLSQTAQQSQMRHILPTNIKMADMISHACRLSYQLYIPSNRIVKPNNRYTRQSASHDFPFYSAPDKVYVLTATKRIAMRFAVRSAPPFRYHTKRAYYSKGGTWSGSQSQAELEAAHSRKNGRHILSVPAVLFLSISRCQTVL